MRKLCLDPVPDFPPSWKMLLGKTCFYKQAPKARSQWAPPFAIVLPWGSWYQRPNKMPDVSNEEMIPMGLCWRISSAHICQLQQCSWVLRVYVIECQIISPFCLCFSLFKLLQKLHLHLLFCCIHPRLLFGSSSITSIGACSALKSVAMLSYVAVT